MENTGLTAVNRIFTEDLSAAALNHIQKEDLGDGDMQRGIINIINYVRPEKEMEIAERNYNNGVSDTINKYLPRGIVLIGITTLSVAVLGWQNRDVIKKGFNKVFLKAKDRLLTWQQVIKGASANQEAIEPEANDTIIPDEITEEGGDDYADLPDA